MEKWSAPHKERSIEKSVGGGPFTVEHSCTINVAEPSTDSFALSERLTMKRACCWKLRYERATYEERAAFKQAASYQLIAVSA
jgi:hypothetical protein